MAAISGEHAGETRVEGCAIREYKNLRDIWVPLSDAVAIFGQNGSGKTNILECLALLLGTAQTVKLASPRLEPPAVDALAAVTRGVAGLPRPPDTALRSVQLVEHPGSDALLAQIPFLRQAAVEGRWWLALGVTRGAAFGEGIERAGLPSAVEVFLAGLARDPVVRFGLQDIDLQDVAGPKVARRFSRTLMARGLPPEVTAHCDELPDVFAPLRLAEPPDASGLWPVMELPPTDEAPIVLQWLSRLRTDDEVNNDLAEAFERAMEPAAALFELLVERMTIPGPTEGDHNWWLHRIGRVRGNEELKLTAPAVSLAEYGDNDGTDFTIQVQDRPVGWTGLTPVLTQLSAGQARWADEALATVTRELDAFAEQARLHARLASELDDTTFLEAVAEVDQLVTRELHEFGMWTGAAIDTVWRALGPVLGAAAQRRLESHADPFARELTLALEPELALLRPKPVVRIFDEPEAHLHITAQRLIAKALQSLRHQRTGVVIASHSPTFLGLDGWSHLHVSRVDGKARIDPLGEAANRARGVLAKDLGVNRGDLLAGIGALLIVEGKHDREILMHLYGTELRGAGFAVVRVHGTENLLATAELDFLDQYLEVPIVVLVDRARVERVRDRTVDRARLTPEERALRDLDDRCKRRGRRYVLQGLTEPDITNYLHTRAIRNLNPNFLDWEALRRGFRASRSDDFKRWALKERNVDLTMAGIRRVLVEMDRLGLPAGSELTRNVNQIVAVVTDPIQIPDDEARP